MKKYVKYGLMALPFLLGLTGFVLAGEAFLDAAFNGVLLYCMENGDKAPNALVEIARWTAPVATATGLLSLVSRYAVKGENFFQKYRQGSVVIYGEDADAEYLKEQMKNRLVKPLDNQFVKAKRYALLMSEEENLAYYAAHKEKLKNHPVCMRCTALSSQDLAGDNLHVFHPEEIGARLFWKESGIYELAKKRAYKLRIAIIGFDRLGQELLLKGLQYNIFDREQKLEYHIFGESEDFTNLYHELRKVEDPVHFHENWKRNIQLLADADLIILAGREEKLATIRELMLAVPEKKVHLVSETAECLELFEFRGRLEVFDWKKQVLRPEYLFEDTLVQQAKALNLRYAHLYKGVAETPENAQAEWKLLDAYTRQSNISSADYQRVRERMLADWGLPSSGEGLSKEQLEVLAELEHIRWCRYHYLNNWTYGVPEAGKTKDGKKRIHLDLCPYETLSEEEKAKDREAVKVLLGIHA